MGFTHRSLHVASPLTLTCHETCIDVLMIKGIHEGFGDVWPVKTGYVAEYQNELMWP